VSNRPIIDVRSINVFYGTSQALFDLSLRIETHQAIAVLGRNGAGKTTLLKTIIGELNIQNGSMTIDGRDMMSMPTEVRVKSGLGYVPQEHGVFGTLTVRENLQIGALYNSDKSAMEYVLEVFPKLQLRLGQLAGTLSGGERKMLAISRALLGRPKILMLDEPTEGVWVGVIEEIAERLRTLAAKMSLLIVEQHVELALSLSSHAIVLDRGRIALQGPPDDVRADPRLMEYLAP
jgi:branched-chain amino acid transport system ATP-binding protein